MSWPRRGQLLRLAIDGARAECVVVLSEDDWNEYANDSVIVPLFREPDARETIVRPRLDGELIADCTVVTSVAQDDLGEPVGECSGDLMAAVAAGVRSYLGIDDLLDPPRVRPRTPGRSSWWPRQGQVCRATRIAPTAKWTVIVSEDSSNVVLDHAVGARLTSVQSKSRRRRWEVPVRGGYVICNDLHAIAHSGFEPRPRQAPPLSRLDGSELRALADRLVATLKL